MHTRILSLSLVALIGCGPSGAQPPPKSAAAASPEPAPTSSEGPVSAPARSDMAPVMIAIPYGWTDLVHASRDEVEAAAPGLYDSAMAMVERNHYSVLAVPLEKDSPDRGSQMTILPAGMDGPVDQTLLDGFVAHNNLGLTADVIVEKKLLVVVGRPIAKVRAEYEGAQLCIVTLTYIFPADSGDVQQLVFTVRAERYPVLAPQLEAIEGTDPGQKAIQEVIRKHQ